MKIKWKTVSPYTGIEEDAPANFAGGGNVHGIGVGPHGEPGIDPKKKKKRRTLIDRDGKIDGRSRSYREHRRKLEAARQKRMENKKIRLSKFIESIKKKTSEMSCGPGYDTAKPMADLQASKKKKKK